MFNQARVFIGGDPELFFRKGGQIIGSEKVIPTEGLKRNLYEKACVVQDGIQVELNPPAARSIPEFGENIRVAFQLIRAHLKGVPGVSCDFTGVIEITEEEINSLSPTSRILGCKPSKNIYGTKPITVDPQTYRKRSAGGHHHFGLVGHSGLYENRIDLIALNDIFVGNTMVLIDRDPGAAERRENYGRAGEYREPSYGIEYRTLSNSWLKNYTLMNLAYGLSEISVACLNTPGLMDELVGIVNIDNFTQAIDSNNWNLAKANFDTIRPFLVKHLPKTGMVLSESTIDRFLTFAEGVEKKGLEHFFPVDPVVAWTEHQFESFPDFLQRIY